MSISINKFIVVIMYLLLTSSSCGKDDGGHKYIIFKNNSEKTIFVARDRVLKEDAQEKIACTTLGQYILPNDEYICEPKKSYTSWEDELSRYRMLTQFWIFDEPKIGYQECDDEYIDKYMEEHLIMKFEVDEDFIKKMNESDWTIVIPKVK